VSGEILLVDDDNDILKMLELTLGREGFRTITAQTGKEALRRAAEAAPVAVILDLHLPDLHGKEVLATLRRDHPDLPVVILTVEERLDEVVDCMRLGALDFIQKPFERMRLLTTVKNARQQGLLRARVAALAAETRGGTALSSIIGDSPAIQRTIELLRRAAKSEITVLIEGETGTGKELAARAIHAESERRDGPFIAINCGAIPESLIESELFGHEKGAFTGATSARPGCFERADGGTIFLDEIGELRSELQTRLLRVLQERRVQRLGSSADQPVDIRVVAATNRDLRAEVEGRRFREDLYYRLAAFTVRLPALRERMEDVPLLAQAFLDRVRRRQGRPRGGFTPEALRALTAYAWHGNVRELENAIERATIVEDGAMVSLSSLPDAIVNAAPGLADETARALPTESVPAQRLDAAAAAAIVAEARSGGAATPERARAEPSTAPRERAHMPAGIDGDASDDANGGEPVIPLEEAERRLIRRALKATGGNIQEAAGLLRVSRATIYRKLERWRLEGREVEARALEH